MKKIDILISDLCNEIDYYKNQALYYQKLYEKSEKKYSQLLDNTIRHNDNMYEVLVKTAMCADEDKLKEKFS